MCNLSFLVFLFSWERWIRVNVRRAKDWKKDRKRGTDREKEKLKKVKVIRPACPVIIGGWSANICSLWIKWGQKDSNYCWGAIRAASLADCAAIAN